MLITTSYKSDEIILKRMQFIMKRLDVKYVERKKKSIDKLLEENNEDEVIVVENEYIKYYNRKSGFNPVFFHPSMALLRINQLKQGDNDVMIRVCELKRGDTFLDCTLGLASDAIVASYIVGSEGKVTGIESESVLAVITQEGLINQNYNDRDLNQAMRRINIENIDHLQKLKSLPDKSYDIVYFDPMFRRGLNKSVSINPIRCVANNCALSEEVIVEAQRVAKSKVVMKENAYSKEFERLGFKRIVRMRRFIYGVIETGEN